MSLGDAMESPTNGNISDLEKREVFRIHPTLGRQVCSGAKVAVSISSFVYFTKLLLILLQHHQKLLKLFSLLIQEVAQE
jgi:hypothetical protein